MSEAVTQSTPNRIPTPEELGFDPGLLREKYAAERSKRLRADANNQYQEIAGKFEHFNVDPYVKPITRAAITEDLDVLIIGGGFGGMLAAVRLQEVGISNFRIIEKAGDFGAPGTGTATPARSAMSRATSTSRFSKRPAISPRSATLSSPRFSLTPNGSVSTSISTRSPASKPKSRMHAGMKTRDAGPSQLIAMTRSRRAS